MEITDEVRQLLLRAAAHRYRVERTKDGFWRVACGISSVAVFMRFDEAVAFAVWRSGR